ncbi:hypothetical protein NFI96_025926 [Prochilodus magdalenae]|nr:hypothetical protein NFI96_025926 [Prochilodus magdalenae]
MCAAESSSSSEDENTERFREAVWSGAQSTPTGGQKDGTQSKRSVPSQHEKDGNELQVTSEFKSHVARKLGAMLDSCISVVSSETPEPGTTACENGDDGEDDKGEGFRLFSTSLPGKWWKEPTPPPAPKRPPAPSSSDSDSEMELRLREAAVSISDLLPPSTKKQTEKETINGGGEDKSSNDSSEPQKKKKKKKKMKKAATEEETCSKGDEAVSHKEKTDKEPRVEDSLMKKKKKKKRIRLDQGE